MALYLPLWISGFLSSVVAMGNVHLAVVSFKLGSLEQFKSRTSHLCQMHVTHTEIAQSFHIFAYGDGTGGQFVSVTG